jgi:2,4-dienoyl-CoA reductase-like NADH-dependent reductase (Old Yellow Enzyme family)
MIDMRQKSKLFSPFTIGGMEFKNRILFPSMCASFCDTEGNITKRYSAFIMERAKGGLGGIIVPGAPYGERAPARPSLDDDRYIPGWTSFADEVHRCGAKLICQLHPAPFDPPRVKDRKNPSEYSNDLIEELVDAIAQTAYRCLQAGVDGVEIHGAREHEIAAFSSPYYNKRTDEYGGDCKGRAKFAADIVRRIKQKCGSDYPLIYRMAADDKFDGGRTVDDGIQFAQLIEAAGADAIHVFTGFAERTSPAALLEEAQECSLVDAAARIKAHVHVPVIAVKRIVTIEQAAKIIDEDKADMVAMGRAFLADPQLINKAMGDNTTAPCRCLGCKQGCLDQNRSLRCVINPMVGQEWKSA